MISFKGMHPESGAKVEGEDGTNGTTATLLTEADGLFRDAFLKGMNSENSQNVKYKEYQAIERQAKETVAWIMEQRVELDGDDAKMLEKLSKLETSMEAAMKIYGEKYNQEFGNIQALNMAIEYPFGDFREGLYPDIVDLQGIFAGLHGVKLSDEDTILFRKLQLEFMKKDPETQARMLWFFDMVDTYVTPKNKAANQKSLHEDILKEIIFDDNNTPYTQWITRVFELFNRDNDFMIILALYLQGQDEFSSKNRIPAAVYFRDYVMDKE